MRWKFASLAIALLLFFAAWNSKIFSTSKEATVLLTGDVMLGRSVMTKSLNVNDPVYPFRQVAARLREADIVFSNLETPIIANCPRSDTGLKFCAIQALAEGLVFAGVDVVNLANNHTLNYGKEGLEQTKKILTANDIKWVGDGNLEIIEKGQMKFGFLGFDFLTKTPLEKDYALVKNSASQVDQLIVGVHWGKEYTRQPAAAQKNIAKKLIENGADVIVGHHPHWVQEIEFIDGKPVYYSLGNFIFDQMWSRETRKGLAVELDFRNNKLVEENQLPIYIETIGQPEWVDNNP
jgi:poly-gamma-glutamate synthesis protein (capsule biosynthesis protein)